jgi:hypothetical protein
MPGSDGLGRVFDVVPIVTSGPAISLKNCNAVSFVITGATAVPTLSIATSFGGTYRAGSFFTPAWVPITRVYWSTATDGTVTWAKATITAAATYTHGTTTGLTTAVGSVFTVFTSQLPNGYNYIKCTVTGSGIGAAVVHDLAVQRTPANLVKLSA